MKDNLADPRATVVTSFLLALPFTILILLLMLGVEVSSGPLDPLLNAEGGRVGSFIVFGALILLLLGLAISGRAVVHNARAGKGIAADPLHLLLAGGILLVLLLFAGAVTVDQHP